MSTENSSIEDELRKWKAIALASIAAQQDINSNNSDDKDKDNANSKLLVQYLMEKVYQQSKNDFETKMPEIVPYLKVHYHLMTISIFTIIIDCSSSISCTHN
jgi:Ca2+-dependent lipid-binding protein